MITNVCPDIFWTTEYFVTKPGIVMQHHKPECHAEKLVHCVQSQSQRGAYIIKIWSFLLHLLNCWLVCNQTCSITSWSVLWEKLDYCIQCQGRREGSKCRWTFVQMIFSLCVQSCLLNISWTAQPFFTKLGVVVYYHEVMCPTEKLVHYLQCQGHSKGLYNQNMTIFTMSSRLLVCLQPNLVW